MSDWEQPSTSLLTGEEEDPIRILQIQLKSALDRIAALEERVNELEAQDRSQRGQAHGA